MRRKWLSLALALAAAPAAAAPKGPAPRPAAGPTSAPTPAPCARAPASALSGVAHDLALQLAAVPAGALVVSGPLAGDTKVPAPERITARVASVVAGALGHGARSVDEAATLSRARSLASRAGTLVHLQTAISRGELSVVADVYPVPRNFWDRVRDPEPSPHLHAFASRRLDAELHALLPPVPLVASHIDKAVGPERTPVAIGCGDVDGDGSLEIVVAGRGGVHLGRLRHGAFVDLASRSWRALSPVAPSPLREPLGGVSIEGDGLIDVGISDRAEALRLDGALAPVDKLGHRIPWPGGGCAHVAGIALSPTVEACASGDDTAAPLDAGHPLDAVAGARVIGRGGRARLVRAGRLAGEATVLLKDDAGRSARVEGAGAQLAVGDLDGDGQPELLGGADTLDPKGDALIVWTWQDDGNVVERLRVAVPTGVDALAVCPPDGSGMAPIAMATGGGVWVVR